LKSSTTVVESMHFKLKFNYPQDQLS